MGQVVHARLDPDSERMLVQLRRRLGPKDEDAHPTVWRLMAIALWALELSPLPARLSRFSRLAPGERARWLELLQRELHAFVSVPLK